MYNAKITFLPNQERPPDKWIKDNLFKRVVEESDLMDKLLDGNKIVVELDCYDGDNEFQMDMNLTYTKKREMTFHTYSPQPYYRTEPKKWEILSKVKALFYKVFKR